MGAIRTSKYDFPDGYRKMIEAIDHCHNVDEAKDIADKAKAIEVYSKEAANVDAERKAHDIRLRAQRRLGQLLAELERTSERERARRGGVAKAALSVVPTKQTEPTLRSPYADALERNHIDRRDAARFQKLALVPKADFEERLANRPPRGLPVWRPPIDGVMPFTDAVRARQLIRRFADDLVYIDPETVADLEKLFPTKRPVPPKLISDVRRLRDYFEKLDRLLTQRQRDEKGRENEK